VSFGFVSSSPGPGGLFDAMLETPSGSVIAAFPGPLEFVPAQYQGAYYSGPVGELEASLRFLPRSRSNCSAALRRCWYCRTSANRQRWAVFLHHSAGLTVSLSEGGLTTGSPVVEATLDDPPPPAACRSRARGGAGGRSGAVLGGSRAMKRVRRRKRQKPNARNSFSTHRRPVCPPTKKHPARRADRVCDSPSENSVLRPRGGGRWTAPPSYSRWCRRSCRTCSSFRARHNRPAFGAQRASDETGAKGSCCCGSGSVGRRLVVSPASVMAYSRSQELGAQPAEYVIHDRLGVGHLWVPVQPLGSNRKWANLSTRNFSGTPYCKLKLIAVANASIRPEMVEPSLAMVMKSSPAEPSSYMPAVM